MAAVDFDIEVLEDGELSVALRRVFEFGDAVGAVGGRREGEVHLAVVLLEGDALHFFQLLHAALHLGGFGGLGAEAIDPLLGLLNLALLRGVLLFEDLFPVGVFREVEGIVAGVFLGAAVVEGDGAGGETIEEGEVVGDEDDRAAVVLEEVLHPALCIDVEVVGGLVEEHEAGLAEEELGHGDAHLPTTGEFAAVALEVFALEAEAIEDRFDAWLDAGRVELRPESRPWLHRLTAFRY